MEEAVELLKQLNQTDESVRIEAKKGQKIDRSIMETVCAFANEPDLSGGNILLGIEEDESPLFPGYKVTGIVNPDKLQKDFSTQCAGMFNVSVRPEIRIEIINERPVMNIFIPELPTAQKPLYFKNEGLPRGAYRRIGSTDQRCTEDDLAIFFNTEQTFDSQSVPGSSWDDLDENAILFYRNFRNRVNPNAEELTYDDRDLLRSLGCLAGQDQRKGVLTYAGLLLFGSRPAQRRLLPMMRLDYIRVPGNEWVADPNNRFTTTLDMRGPLLALVQRAINAVSDDLPKGFLLLEDQVQAESVGLPGRVLREALVNALMHRSYRVNQAVQVIRYSNRIEIINPGYSLKSQEHLGEPGSKVRNPYIAAVFHETNLAETKGSGIRTMRRLMEEAQMVPPTFESDHTDNKFTARLLLHHFLNEADLTWLRQFEPLALNDNQKKALIFLREVGAINNLAYRQLNGCENLKAGAELRALRGHNLMEQKGKGRATYYIPSPQLSAPPADLSAPVSTLSTPPPTLIEVVGSDLFNQLPEDIRNSIEQLGRRSNDQEEMKQVILMLCTWKPQKLEELSTYLGREKKYILRKFIQPLMHDNLLKYTIPDMPNHPDQAYKTPLL